VARARRKYSKAERRTGEHVHEVQRQAFFNAFEAFVLRLVELLSLLGIE
jgi:hypothetical protein